MYKKRLIDEVEKINSVKENRLTINTLKYVEKKYASLLEEFVKNGQVNIKCKAISNSVFLDPSGNLYPCTSFDKKLGNIRDYMYDTKEILNLDISKKLIKNIGEECPKCWTPCEANQMILSNVFH